VTIANTKALVAARLATITSPVLNRIYTSAVEAVSMDEFPVAVITLAPAVDHAQIEEAMGLGRHDYQLAIWIFVGARSTGIEELQDRAELWPEPLMDCFAADLTLGGETTFIGYPDSDALFVYRVGELLWADGQYYGLKVTLPVTEKRPITMG
jgi:hypothetical protein